MILLEVSLEVGLEVSKTYTRPNLCSIGSSLHPLHTHHGSRCKLLATFPVPSLSVYLSACLPVCLSICVCTCCGHVSEVRDQLAEVSSLLPTVWVQGIRFYGRRLLSIESSILLVPRSVCLFGAFV